MSQIRLYVDEDALDRDVIAGLRRLGIDLITVADAGELGYSDERHLNRAVKEGRVFYTLNSQHFSKLHRDLLAGGSHHPGILTIPRQRYSIGDKIRRIAEFIDLTSAEDMVDRMEYL